MENDARQIIDEPIRPVNIPRRKRISKECWNSKKEDEQKLVKKPDLGKYFLCEMKGLSGTSVVGEISHYLLHIHTAFGQPCVLCAGLPHS